MNLARPTAPRTGTPLPRLTAAPGALAALGFSALGLLALVACSPVAYDPTPRLLTPQELRAGIDEAQTATPSATADSINARAAALRGRAATLRSQPVLDPGENDILRRRARGLTPPAT